MKNVPEEAMIMLSADSQASRDALLHERAILCARLARLLRRSLHGLAWEELRFGDRSRLERALSGLGADIPLVWLIAGQEYIAGQEMRNQAVPMENKEASDRREPRVREKKVC